MKNTPASFNGPIVDSDLLDYRDGGHMFRPDLPAGSIHFTSDTQGEICAIDFVCPCGCGAVGCLPTRKGFGGSSWSWDGDKEKPTLSPSVLRTAGCKWHGYLKKGIWEQC